MKTHELDEPAFPAVSGHRGITLLQHFSLEIFKNMNVGTSATGTVQRYADISVSQAILLMDVIEDRMRRHVHTPIA